jgi:hypothetical protein
MSQVIIYNKDNGVPAVVTPTPEALSNKSIQQIAEKDVPTGYPFKIIDVSELPQDTPQESWEVDDTDLTDGVGA